MPVHTATAPNAVLRTLPALPRELWVPSLEAAWSATAAVTAAYAPPFASHAGAGVPVPAAEVFERTAAHGDEHAVKFADPSTSPGRTAGRTDEPAVGRTAPRRPPRCVRWSSSSPRGDPRAVLGRTLHRAWAKAS